jgi:hypothetical protein
MLSPNGLWDAPPSFKSPAGAWESCSWEVLGYGFRSRARNASLNGVPKKPYFSRSRFSR